MRRALIRGTLPALLAALLLLAGSRPAGAIIALTGEWHFSIEGDLTLTCPTTLEQTGTSLTGTFDCTEYIGELQGIVTPKIHGQSFEAAVLFTDLHGDPIDAWDIAGDVPGDGNHMTGTWTSTVFEDHSGTLEGIRDVAVYLKGDVNCDGDVDGLDVLSAARWIVQLDPLQPPECPEIGSQFAGLFGDMNCSGLLEAIDAIDVLTFAAGLPVDLPHVCLPIGELYTAPATTQP